MVEASLVNIAELGVLVVGVVIALQQLNDIKKTRETELETRQIQILMDIFDKSSTVEFHKGWTDVLNQEWTDYEEWLEKYGPANNPEMMGKWYATNRFLIHLGLLIKEKVVDSKLIYDMDPMDSIILTWEKFEPIYKARRGEIPRSGQLLEYAANEMKKLQTNLNLRERVNEWQPASPSPFLYPKYFLH